MMIYIDADACPVTRIAEDIARRHRMPVTLLCDTNHVLTSDYSTVKVVGAGADAVDIGLINLCRRGDVVITQDYGVAALALGRGARAIHQSGKWFTDDNIDGLLMDRHLAKKARRSGKHHLKGPAKRTEADDKRFAESFERMLDEAKGEGHMIIRQAKEEDVPQIAKILVEDWQTAYRGIMDDDFLDSLSAAQRYQIEIKRYQKYTVAADGDVILGYAWSEETDGEAADCEIIALYVRYSERKNGIGRALMRHAMDTFRNAGKKTMIVWCLKENHESRKFYEKMGGKAYKEGTHQWGGREYDMIAYLYSLDG